MGAKTQQKPPGQYCTLLSSCSSRAAKRERNTKNSGGWHSKSRKLHRRTASTVQKGGESGGKGFVRAGRRQGTASQGRLAHPGSPASASIARRPERDPGFGASGNRTVIVLSLFLAEATATRTTSELGVPPPARVAETLPVALASGGNQRKPWDSSDCRCGSCERFGRGFAFPPPSRRSSHRLPPVQGH